MVPFALGWKMNQRKVSAFQQYTDTAMHRAPMP